MNVLEKVQINVNHARVLTNMWRMESVKIVIKVVIVVKEARQLIASLVLMDTLSRMVSVQLCHVNLGLILIQKAIPVRSVLKVARNARAPSIVHHVLEVTY